MWKQPQAEMLNPFRSQCVQGGEDTGRSDAGELESWRALPSEKAETRKLKDDNSGLCLFSRWLEGGRGEVGTKETIQRHNLLSSPLHSAVQFSSASKSLNPQRGGAPEMTGAFNMAATACGCVCSRRLSGGAAAVLRPFQHHRVRPRLWA